MRTGRESERRRDLKVQVAQGGLSDIEVHGEAKPHADTDIVTRASRRHGAGLITDIS